VWTGGGYVGLPILSMAIYGLICRRRALLPWLLAVWMGLALAKTFGIQPLARAWNVIPGIAETSFFRYATSSWILALVILASFGLDRLARTSGAGRRAAAVAGAITAAILVAGVAGIVSIENSLHPSPALRNWAVASLSWAAIITVTAPISGSPRSITTTFPWRLVGRAGSRRTSTARRTLLFSMVTIRAGSRVSRARRRSFGEIWPPTNGPASNTWSRPLALTLSGHRRTLTPHGRAKRMRIGC